MKNEEYSVKDGHCRCSINCILHIWGLAHRNVEITAVLNAVGICKFTVRRIRLECFTNDEQDEHELVFSSLHHTAPYDFRNH